MTQIEPSRGRILVSGILFWYPLAGVTYQFLHYLIGLRRLGYDPYYVEDSARYVYDPRINDMTSDADGNVAAIAPILEANGFADRWSFRGAYPGGRCYGLSQERVRELYGEADAFLNVTGAQELRDEHMKCRLRVYVESDPVASQIQVANGDAKMIRALEAHHLHFSFGENLGQPDCAVPIERFEWLPTRQPVALELWDAPPIGDSAKFTTITTWSHRGKDVVYDGETYYWSKDREFKKILDLPQRRSVEFELALRVGAETETLLHDNGWRTTGSLEVSRDTTSYQRYIRESLGELTVAKDQYTRVNSGWFSDRSACYLAAGRPVITQETGFSKILPTGEGLFGFTTMDDILTAVDTIERNRAAASRAAREIAREYFSAEKVVGSLLQRAGL